MLEKIQWGTICTELCKTAREIGDLFLPSSCACCGAYGSTLESRTVLCPRCDFLLRHSLLNVHRAHLRYDRPVCYASGLYEHEVATAVLAYKNGGRTDLLPYFAAGMSRTVEALLTSVELAQPSDQPLLLIPIPSEVASHRRRGYAPAELLAQATAKVLIGNGLDRSMGGVKVVYALRKKRSLFGFLSPGAGQKTLGVLSREARMQNSLELAPPPLGFLGFEYNMAGSLCLLVDDVATTGASLKAAYRVLEKAGATVCGAVTLAAVPRHDSPASESADEN